MPCSFSRTYHHEGRDFIYMHHHFCSKQRLAGNNPSIIICRINKYSMYN